MTSPVEAIMVDCPKCREVYPGWWRPSVNLMLDDFDSEYLEEATTSTCPKCKHKVRHDVLIVRGDGVWELASTDKGDP